MASRYLILGGQHPTRSLGTLRDRVGKRRFRPDERFPRKPDALTRPVAQQVTFQAALGIGDPVAELRVRDSKAREEPRRLPPVTLKSLQ